MFEEHLRHPHRHGHTPRDAHSGYAGGAACGDLVRISLRVEGDRVAEAGFDASGCGGATAAGSAAVALAEGRPLLEVARLGTHELSAELGGLSPGKLHAAELAADALHRALGAAARGQADLRADPDRTLVAMSGGVDSAVAALLVDRDREAVGVTLELWRDEDNDAEASCCSASAVRAARAVAHGMGLPHLTVDLRDEFRAGVVEPFLAGHAAGTTPNPCVGCNGHVRLDAMLALAGRLGAADLATGHYARRTPDGLLRTAADPAKDQVYMLSALSPGSLAQMRFPLGDRTKPQVRALAAEAGLPVAAKADSQDLCFLAGTGKAAFLARHGGPAEREGAILDRAGREVGRHRGHHLFTVGQRRGLGLGGTGDPLYVLGTSAAANTVTVGPHAALATRRVALRGAVLHRPGDDVDRVRLRYHAPAHACRVEGEPDAGRHRRLTLELEASVDGVAPGQVACLMRGETVLGWGVLAGAADAPRSRPMALDSGV